MRRMKKRTGTGKIRKRKKKKIRIKIKTMIKIMQLIQRLMPGNRKYFMMRYHRKYWKRQIRMH